VQYVNIPRKEQIYFIKDAKNKLNTTWQEFANALGVSLGMVYFYARGDSHLPLNSYLFLCNKMKIFPRRVPTVEISNKLKSVEFPIFCEKLAEFLGILAGDGHISADPYEVCVSLDKNSDKEYVPYVCQLFIDLFGLKPTLFNQQNVTKCRVYARDLVQHLTSRYGFVTGNKMNRLKIPKLVWRNDKYLAAYLRGFFDTDGSFHGRRKTDAVVEFISCDKKFLQELADALRSLDFKAGLSGKSIYIYAKKDIHRFFEIIRSSSPKNLKKYQYYLENGRVPSSSEALIL